MVQRPQLTTSTTMAEFMLGSFTILNASLKPRGAIVTVDGSDRHMDGE